LNPALNPETDLIGIRIPDNGFIRQVAKECAFPIALTSANLSSWKSSLSIDEFEDLWPSLEVVCDGGKLGDRDPERLGSTVVDLSRQGAFKLIREGCAADFVKEVLIGRHYLEER
jgi:tRNA A37 threonylcarbamoyladenosine synthetase subunit TsaC/SUA5/YrdC